MKLLTIETRQYLTYYHSRYRQVQAFGVDLYVMNGEGTADFWPADHYRLVGSKKIDEMVACAEEWHATEHFDGVITFSEAAVIAVATVAEALGLPGIGVEAARNSRNKLLMRQAYERAGVPIPAFRYVTELDDALAAGAEFGYPVILKPTLGAGSHLVYRVDGPQEMARDFATASEGLRNMFWINAEADDVDLGPIGLLVESFLDGPEYLMEALAWDDEVYLGSVVDRITAEGRSFDDDVHHAPTSLPAEELARVHHAVKAAARAQGLRRSVMHAEVRYHEGKPHLLEIAARVGGGGLDTIARITADYDPIRSVVDVGRGVKPPVRHYWPTGTHITAMCLICDGGVVESIEVPPEVTESDRVFLQQITARPGDVILRPPDGNTIFGFLGTTGTSKEDAYGLMTELAGKITVTLEGDR
ncbi:ATP-grasp domain-containing protein [Amycolatopsis sp. SB7-3]|uniref:ATP-grasp domain-containing protein n=1 Tax=Amycolatopsis sp. SB7-3 TaxID=3373438 RepID=UPI00374246AD